MSILTRRRKLAQMVDHSIDPLSVPGKIISPLETHQHNPSCVPMAVALAQIAEVLTRIWILMIGMTISLICYLGMAIWKMLQ